MKATLIVALAIAVASVVPAAGEDASRSGPSQPFFDARRQIAEYAGPGRDDPEPSGIDEIRIGYFGPDDPDDPLGGDLWLASRLAVDEANRVGGYHGIPFRLVPAWSETPWGTGVADLARIVYSDGVWAIVGSIDGASTHLAEQVVAKARLTLINPAGTDKTVNLANVAWMFSCLPADDAHALALGPAIAAKVHGRPFAVISATDHDSHHAASELTTYLAREGLSPAYSLEFEPGALDFSLVPGQLESFGAVAVVVIASPLDSARVVSAVRRFDGEMAVFGGPSTGRRAFLDAAGPDAEGVVFPLSCDPRALTGSFAAQFWSRFGRRPDCTTAQTYDATRVVIEAIRSAGLNRARIRDAVRALSPWTGVSGTIDWDALGQNLRDVRPATIEGGRIRQFCPVDDVE